MSKDLVLNRIINILERPLQEKGFNLRKLKSKTIFERQNDRGQIQEYEIKLSKEKGYYHLHLVLHIKDRKQLKLRNEILKKVLMDKRYAFPSNWSEKNIKDSINARTKTKDFFSLTDWRSLKDKNESLEDFNSRFSMWMCCFDELDEIKNWKKQLVTSVELADKFFLKIDNEYIINNTKTNLLAMTLLKDDLKRLDLYYQKSKVEMLSQKRDTFEMDVFYEYLKTNN